MGILDTIKKSADERRKLREIEKQAYKEEMIRLEGDPIDKAKAKGKEKAQKKKEGKSKSNGSFLDSMLEPPKNKSNPLFDEFNSPKKNDAFEELFGK